MPDQSDKPFLSDVETLRARARVHLEDGALTPAYRGDVNKAIDILQTVLATELVCMLQLHAALDHRVGHLQPRPQVGIC
jgi:bacterioferritin